MTEQTKAEKGASQWATKGRGAITQRNYWIREARREGASLRRIGDLTGLSHTAIKKILDRADPEGLG